MLSKCRTICFVTHLPSAICLHASLTFYFKKRAQPKYCLLNCVHVCVGRISTIRKKTQRFSIFACFYWSNNETDGDDYLSVCHSEVFKHAQQLWHQVTIFELHAKIISYSASTSSACHESFNWFTQLLSQGRILYYRSFWRFAVLLLLHCRTLADEVPCLVQERQSFSLF